MVSSKGEPDNPKLREQCKEEVKNMEKGGGKGSWSAWKAGELARLYESKGGGYKDTGDNKNKAQAGAPERKDGKDNKGAAGQKKKEKEEKEAKKEEKSDDSKKKDEKKTEEKTEKDDKTEKSEKSEKTEKKSTATKKGTKK